MLQRFLASLHLYSQSSSSILKLSMLLDETKVGKGGKEHFIRFLNEYNEWMVQQQMQQAAVLEFLRGYYKG